jgi:hypothetical protein
MHYIEINTCEGGRFTWAAIYGDTNTERLIRWGYSLIRGVDGPPNLRVTKGIGGIVVGGWDESGTYTRVN